MGLGKTIQTIGFLKYLWHNYPFKGPMLVCVPLSTMSAWQKEFEQWAPEMNMVVYNGNAVARQIIREYECYDRGGAITFNVLLTNYELVIKDRTFFEEVKWSNIAVDEAHRLKSEESLLY
jgi:SNF2 family DNA or RNA helicase